MTKKIIIIGLALFLLYNAVLFVFPIQKKYVYTDVEKVDKFLYAGRKFKVISSGSSLIGNFTLEAQKRKDYYNLSLPPGGGCTGVKLLALDHYIPDTLYLETNYISRGFNNKLIDNALNPFHYYGKLIFPAFQEQHKLIPLMIDKLKSGAPVNMASKKRPADELFQKMFAKTKLEYDTIPDPTAYNGILRELKTHLDYLVSKGTKVVFFEVPIEKALTHSPKLTYQRKAVHEMFNDSTKYKFIAPDTVSTYYTGDGKHLLLESFQRFTKYFKYQASLLKGK